MQLQPFDYFLWFTASILMLAVCGLMIRRGLARRYPYFFAYAALQFVSVPVLFAAVQSYASYFWGYYAVLTLSILLSLGALWEILRYAFAKDYPARSMFGLVVPWSLLIALVVSIVTLHPKHWEEVGPITTGIIAIERVLRFAQCALVLLLIAFRKRLGISMRNILFGVALGFGWFATVSILISSSFLMQSFSQVALRQANSLSYVVACTIWLVYLAAGSSDQPAFKAGAGTPKDVSQSQKLKGVAEFSVG